MHKYLHVCHAETRTHACRFIGLAPAFVYTGENRFSRSKLRISQIEHTHTMQVQGSRTRSLGHILTSKLPNNTNQTHSHFAGSQAPTPASYVQTRTHSDTKIKHTHTYTYRFICLAPAFVDTDENTLMLQTAWSLSLERSLWSGEPTSA